MITVYDRLRESHEKQRSLCAALVAAKRVERTHAAKELAIELAAHAAAEERYLYAPMLMNDAGLSSSRHALSEHHEAEELVEKLRSTDPSERTWLTKARELAESVTHHLDEEEHGFFQLSGRILTDKQKIALAEAYETDYQRMKAKLMNE
jgi:uncharacterized protein YyaL (SSP411 family)